MKYRILSGLGLLMLAWLLPSHSPVLGGPSQRNSTPSKSAVPNRSEITGNLRIRNLTFAEARPVLESFADELPAELRVSAAELERKWPNYVRQREAEIEARLLRGEEDSLANLLLFGTSFTRQPRVTSKLFEQLEAHEDKDEGVASRVLRQRTSDLIRGLQHPGENERLLQMRQLLQRQGYRLESTTERSKLEHYLLGIVVRARGEFRSYNQKVDAARATGDLDEEFAVRSTLFQTRGLSLDTSIMPDFALEQALIQLRDHNLLQRNSVHRVAIIGPGLDFVNKQEGYDFYPLQTTQPFAVIDSLLRLGLARKDDLQVTTLDISPRVNQHILRSRSRARQGLSYTLQLPLNGEKQWKPEALAYWKQFGRTIGSSTAAVAAPAGIGKTEIRAVRIPAALMLQIHPKDLNVVWQREELEAGQRYDLVVATNVLVYYNEFEQALALDNVQSMLRGGGFLLTNNGLPEVSTLKMKQIGHSTSVYSERSADGDHVIWYQRAP